MLIWKSSNSWKTGIDVTTCRKTFSKLDYVVCTFRHCKYELWERCNIFYICDWCMYTTALYKMLTACLGASQNGYTCTITFYKLIGKFLSDSILSHHHEYVIGQWYKWRDSGRGAGDGWRGRIVTELLRHWCTVLNNVENIVTSAIRDGRCPCQCNAGAGSSYS